MLEWYVYVGNWNGKKIEPYNVFDHGSLMEDLRKDAKKVHIRDDRPEEKKAFLERLKQNLMYYYWGKAEWEIVLSPWMGQAKEIKVDVYDQVMLNWGIFSEYVWANRAELKKKK